MSSNPVSGHYSAFNCPVTRAGSMAGEFLLPSAAIQTANED
jgi:hypothetical protein